MKIHSKIYYLKYLLLVVILFFSVLFLNSCAITDKIEQFPNWFSQLTNEEKLELANTNNMTENRQDYESDAIFANFRPINVGKLKKNHIFRGASPYLNNTRTKYVNKYLEKYNIQTVISLSESKEEIENYLESEETNNNYFSTNFKNNAFFDYTLDYESIDLNNRGHVETIIKSFKYLMNDQGNIYIHCHIGRDRTGIYCMLIEALCGASYQEMVDDYMESFKNYSFIDKFFTPNKYEEIKATGIDTMLKTLANIDNDSNTDLQKIDYANAAKNFLINNDMSDADINALISAIT